MINHTLKVKCTGEYPPTKGTPYAAGLDLYNNDRPETFVAGHNQTIKIDTKTHVEIPQGYVGLVFPRSSFGSAGLRLANTVGVIDSDYRGPIITALKYEGNQEVFKLDLGERYAQLVIVPHFVYEMELVKELNETERGEGGFGSTGRK